ncbi:CocE/NonD family hydrolase [Frankia sp. AgPm24]|uniref:CocE/NonD family hydrolase n=1 Tax=Frankia sp. AgPm24 TaxID=631128 RepID=UPI00200D3D73|nr:CocE/NonD family hydrolase [Frankia sp. AgPm24]MCK9921753.1 CocE/NonD family hydrolase [Frankia sp. AgPm24]
MATLRIDANQRVPAADGLGLATDVYLPTTLPAPVVVTRTPYGRGALLANGAGWARHGFVFVAQDVRGRYGSDGVWTPYRGERGDGAALVEWVHRQLWCDGNVILAGASYGSFTAWAAALAVPHLVRTVISEVPAAGLRAANVDPSGVLRLAEYAGWWTDHAEARVSRDSLAGRMLLEDPDLLRSLPIADLGQRLWARLPRWWNTIAGNLRDGPVDRPHAERRHTEPGRGATPGGRSSDDETLGEPELAACPLPALHIGGWYDLFLPQTLSQWTTAGRDRAPRPARGLVIGPWGHELSSPSTSAAGGRDHGPESQLPLGRLQVAWIRGVLAGDDPSLIKVFVVGERRWSDRWPAATSTRRLHAAADGHLTEAFPREVAGRSFVHDPADPHPSLPVSQDRTVLDCRADRVAFRTGPQPSPPVLAGTPVIRLRADTTAPSADWIGRLVERRADGRTLEIASGSAAVGSGASTVEIPLDPIALRPAPGSRLELQLTGSDFPRLARNLNTGRDRYTTAAVGGPAIQTVHLGPDHTWIDLPIRERP